MNTEYGTANEYYASANSYVGFESYFGEIFNSSRFTKIFVLKGGPGTGKSTILKKIAKFAKNQKINFEIFRCSSDPASLDAVIIDDGKRRVAILDGTAPHERDAVIPGAVDELVNLGEAWDSEGLEKCKNKILKINFEKNKSYKNAYKNLGFSSIFATNIKAEIESRFDFKKAKKASSDAFSTLSDAFKFGNSDIRLISSFSKNGYSSLKTPYFLCDKIYSVRGRFGSENIFLKILIDELTDKNVSFCKIPSPLDKDIFEGIYFRESKMAILAMGDGEELCDTSSFLNIDDYSEFNDYITPIENSKEFYLKRAADALVTASEYHFMLEDIYTPNMNFDLLDKIGDGIIERIEKIFLSSV
ncbi:MAG: hypothetical protein IJY23_02890 [Clostridia bacterium]|nr:hypothetical protein [Clostridia bacterium]